MKHTGPFWLASALSLMFVGCSDPCEELDERVCADLGADCSHWHSGQTRYGLLPDPDSASRGRRAFTRELLKQRPEDAVCRTMSEDGNYQSYTLPMATYLTRVAKDPATAGKAPSLPAPQASSGFPPWLMYSLGPIAIVGVLAYTMLYSRRSKQPPV